MSHSNRDLFSLILQLGSGTGKVTICMVISTVIGNTTRSADDSPLVLTLHSLGVCGLTFSCSGVNIIYTV